MGTCVEIPVRPKTGQLLVGGDLFKTLDSGTKGEWMQCDEPCEYLHLPEKLFRGKGGIVKEFIVPALKARLSQFIFDVPLTFSKDGSIVTPMDDINVFFLEEGHPWEDAYFLNTLSLREDLIVTEKMQGNNMRVARRWDREWFFSKMILGLEERYELLRTEYLEVKDVKRGRELGNFLTENRLVLALIKTL